MCSEVVSEDLCWGGRRHGKDTNYGVCEGIIVRMGFSCSSFSSFTVQKAVWQSVLLTVLESQGHWRTVKIVVLLYDDIMWHSLSQGHDACWNSIGPMAWARQIWENSSIQFVKRGLSGSPLCQTYPGIASHQAVLIIPNSVLEAIWQTRWSVYKWDIIWQHCRQNFQGTAAALI